MIDMDKFITARAEKVSAMEKRILKAKVQYYQKGKPIMSDQAYDKLEKKLSSWCPNHPILQMVGFDLNSQYTPLTVEQIKNLFTESVK